MIKIHIKPEVLRPFLLDLAGVVLLALIWLAAYVIF